MYVCGERARDRDIYFKELAHMNVEVGKFKICRVSQQPEGPGKSQFCSSNPKTICWQISTSSREVRFWFLFLFFLLRSSTDWVRPIHVMEKAMATYSSTLAWKIPWTEEPGGLQSMGSRRIRHDWVTSLSLSTFMHWRRKWQPTPVFLPGESQRRQSLVGCRLWGHTESDTTEVT